MWIVCSRLIIFGFIFIDWLLIWLLIMGVSGFVVFGCWLSIICGGLMRCCLLKSR